MLRSTVLVARSFARNLKPRPATTQRPTLATPKDPGAAIDVETEDGSIAKIDKYREMGYNPQQIVSLLDKTNQSGDVASIDQLISYARSKSTAEDGFLDEVQEIAEIDKIVKSNDTKMHHTRPTRLRKSEQTYDKLINEVLDGNSLVSGGALGGSFNSRIAKKFTEEELEQVREERKKLLEKRGETETFLKVFENKDLRLMTPEETRVQKDRAVRPHDLDHNIDDIVDLPMSDVLELGLSKQERRMLMQRRAEHIAKLTGDDVEDVLSELKSEFFQAKQLEEENARFELNMKKRERRREIKEMLKRLSKNEFEVSELEKEDPSSVESVSYKRDPDKDSEEMERQKLELSRKLAQQMYGQQDEDMKLETFSYVKFRTSKNFHHFLINYFNPLNNKGFLASKGECIAIDEVFISRNMHIAYVFWDLLEPHDDASNELQARMNEVNESLNRSSKKIASVMLRELGLRKPPVLYFFVSKLRAMQKKLREDYEAGLKESIIEELKEKSPERFELLVNTGQLDKFINEKREEVLVKTADGLNNFVSNAPFVKGLLRERRRKECGHDGSKEEAAADGKNKKKDKKKSKKKKEAPEAEFWNKIMKGGSMK